MMDWLDNNGFGEEQFALGDFDLETGYLYCGGKERYLEVVRILFEDCEEVKSKVIEYYASQDWKNYVITVHGIKSSMLSIGAMDLSAMAKELEAAGKREDIEYIHRHHEDMLMEYDRVCDIMRQNKLVNPKKEAVILDCDLPELGQDELQAYVDEFEGAVYEFDSEKMSEILSKLEQYQYHGRILAELIAPVKRKMEMMDYMSALSVLEKIKNS